MGWGRGRGGAKGIVESGGGLGEGGKGVGRRGLMGWVVGIGADCCVAIWWDGVGIPVWDGVMRGVEVTGSFGGWIGEG